jgi:two-component system sensor histidine kinase AtoS
MITILNEQELQLIAKYQKENPEFERIVSKVLQQYNLDLSKFSHELRNPITLISSSLQLIESQHPEVKEFKFWKETMDDIQYVCCLLDELSSYNKSSSLNITSFSITELILSTCNSINNHCNHTRQIFTYHYSSDLPPLMNGDRVKIREVLINLLKNAKDAINLEHGTISLNAYMINQDFIQIEISDDGCGIPLEYQKTIFEPFVTYKPNGSGLGLTICKNIIVAHNGHISFISTPDVGTTFFISLPLSL